MDTMLAYVLVIVGTVVLVGMLTREETRAAVGVYFGAAVVLLSVSFLGIFYLSSRAARKSKGSGDATVECSAFRSTILHSTLPGTDSPQPPSSSLSSFFEGCLGRKSPVLAHTTVRDEGPRRLPLPPLSLRNRRYRGKDGQAVRSTACSFARL